MFDFAGSGGDLREAAVSVQDRGVRLRAGGCSIIVTFRAIRHFFFPGFWYFNRMVFWLACLQALARTFACADIKMYCITRLLLTVPVIPKHS